MVELRALMSPCYSNSDKLILRRNTFGTYKIVLCLYLLELQAQPEFLLFLSASTFPFRPPTMEKLPDCSIGNENIMTQGYMNATQQRMCELQTDKIASDDLNLEHQEYFPLGISSDQGLGHNCRI